MEFFLVYILLVLPTHNENINIIVPVISYLNADSLKSNILDDNRKKTGIYKGIHILSGKYYIGSATYLSGRFINYFNISFLENEVKKNNSRIYKDLIKNGYSEFRLEIIEYCESDILIEVEQYYLDTLKLEYNIKKKQGPYMDLDIVRLQKS
jgi:hypothetical protein